VRLEAGSITQCSRDCPESIRPLSQKVSVSFLAVKSLQGSNSLLNKQRFGLSICCGVDKSFWRGNWEHQVVGILYLLPKNQILIWRNLSWQMLGSTLRMGGSCSNKYPALRSNQISI